MLKIVRTLIGIAAVGICFAACSNDNSGSDAQGATPTKAVGVCGLTGENEIKAKSACKKACEAKLYDTTSCQRWGFAGGLAVDTNGDVCGDDYDEEMCRSTCCTYKQNGAPMPKICTELLAQSACSVSRKDLGLNLGNDASR